MMDRKTTVKGEMEHPLPNPEEKYSRLRNQEKYSSS